MVRWWIVLVGEGDHTYTLDLYDRPDQALQAIEKLSLASPSLRVALLVVADPIAGLAVMNLEVRGSRWRTCVPDASRPLTRALDDPSEGAAPWGSDAPEQAIEVRHRIVM